MAAKYMHSLADENPDLQKQIGCVTGIFQIFNRHHIVSRRRVFSHSPKRGYPDGLLFNNGSPRRESSVMGQRHMTEEKHRVSSKDSSASRRTNSQNPDLRDVVKDSMYREARGLSHNVEMKTESSNWYGDEPRELSRSKSCQFRNRIPSSICKDYPWFSYDGRDSNTTNQPRLSLDSKDRSLSLVTIQPSNLKHNHSSNLKISGDARPPGVLAKLMGLETLKSHDDCRDMKPISRGQIEATPWKQHDGIDWDGICLRQTNMDKRFKNLEFAESGKDLRALKQMFDNQNPPCVMDVSRGHIKPLKLVKGGFKNSKMGKDLSTCSERQPSKPRKLSFKQPSESNSSSLVSVLDDSVYVDNSPSLVKHTPITKKDDANVKDRYEATTNDQSITIPRVSFQTNREKVKKVEDLVQKLKNFNSSHNDGDDLKWEDVLEKSVNWRGFCGESPVIAMEVEWLILTDLVNEVFTDS